MKKILTLLFASAFLAISCEDEKDQITVTADEFSYFPLELGSRWEYEGIGPASINGSATFTIVSIENINGKEYYAMETLYSDDGRGWSSRDTVFFRIDERGFVYEINNNAGERNRFRLGATEGYRWTMASFSKHNFNVVTTIGDFELESETLRDCKTYSYDIPQMADEEHYYILAKDIGIVQHGNSWGFNYRLKGRPR